MPLPGWRANVQSELQNKTLTATNARLRREADKLARQLEWMQAQLQEALKQAACSKERIGRMENAHARELAAFESRRAEEATHVRDAVSQRG